MLVQGLVKARSDAVDGDGAMLLDPAPLPDTVTDGVPAPAVLPLRALLSEQSSPVAAWPGSLPPVSPITPLSHDDDSGADDATNAVCDLEATPNAVCDMEAKPNAVCGDHGGTRSSRLPLEAHRTGDCTGEHRTGDCTGIMHYIRCLA